ncbi:hypothetical protein [Bacteriovorax sp. Seq25_V]|uniref:hypothetical protein n=1 Tax=Bacteriovorax sp. Seq25_V TaxID=1201288 RepID=UPI00038A3E1C|nr:hypothetical protein [Bacteriovorax sp. Seq25_V]EQC47753.1 hypothetical protein M900_A0171 [Bacteriovorax sp. Seq25_V]
MKNKYAVLKNGGIYNFKSHSSKNYVNTLITLLKLSGNRNSSNFSFISNVDSAKYEDTSVQDYILCEHTLDFFDQDIKNLFKNKDCMHLYDLISNKIEKIDKLKYHTQENLFLFSLVKALLHCPNRTLFMEIAPHSINEFTLKRVMNILDYEARTKKRLIIIAANSGIFRNDFFDGVIIKDSHGKYSIDPMQTEINATKYVA